ncbi:hypothetical protein [Mycetocola sp. JXN-3]|uniref:hypothetical protein n=1 Tax=Mycetocola sp. JXN-3 TaxID=2116510 RepID=UPI00165D23A8|nr:hypothetical protein [Mycetocola sp. JXN-3]
MSNPIAPWAKNERPDLGAGNLASRRSRWFVRVVAGAAVAVVVGAAVWLMWPRPDDDGLAAAPAVTERSQDLVGAFESSLQETLDTLYIAQTPDAADQLTTAALNPTASGRAALETITATLKKDAVALQTNGAWDGKIDSVLVFSEGGINSGGDGEGSSTLSITLTITRHMVTANQNWSTSVPVEMVFDNKSVRLTDITMGNIDAQP